MSISSSVSSDTPSVGGGSGYSPPYLPHLFSRSTTPNSQGGEGLRPATATSSNHGDESLARFLEMEPEVAKDNRVDLSLALGRGAEVRPVKRGRPPGRKTYASSINSDDSPNPSSSTEPPPPPQTKFGASPDDDTTGYPKTQLLDHIQIPGHTTPLPLILETHTTTATHPTRKRASASSPYQCPFEGCTRTFTRKSHLISHSVTHTGSRDFVCKRCGRTFARGHDLQRHMKTAHSEVRLYRCEVCLVACKRKDSLRKHLAMNCRGKEGMDESVSGSGSGEGEEDEGEAEEDEE
ncbi:hypothetical protein HDU67_005016 [Dinochytrium kinnereticum]|nr:hypothetical protein HDU67_005016 [Dinochytrium kinnereticum]